MATKRRRKLIEQQNGGVLTDQEFGFATIWIVFYSGMVVITLVSKTLFSALEIAGLLIRGLR